MALHLLIALHFMFKHLIICRYSMILLWRFCDVEWHFVRVKRKVYNIFCFGKIRLLLSSYRKWMQPVHITVIDSIVDDIGRYCLQISKMLYYTSLSYI